MHRGYILKWRKQTDWEWYTDVPVRVLFDHLQLVASHKEVSIRGVKVIRGQYQRSYRKLATDTGLSLQQVRTAITKLSKTGEISTHTSTQGMMVITIHNYDYYQTPENYTNTESNKRATQHQHKNNNDKNDKKKDKKIGGVRFTPPPLAEVEAYFKTKNSFNGEAEKFFDHFTSNGWKVGRTPMKDWKSAARNWIRRAPEFKGKKNIPKEPEITWL